MTRKIKWFPGIRVNKDPDSVLDWQWDYTDWLSTGDTVSSIVVEVPAGITKDSDTNDTTSATVWLSGGTAGNTYGVTVRATTAQGRTVDRTVNFVVAER